MKINNALIVFALLFLSACQSPTAIYSDTHYSDAIHVSNDNLRYSSERPVEYVRNDIDRQVYAVSGQAAPNTGHNARLQQDAMQMRMNLHRMEMMQNRPVPLQPSAHMNNMFNR